jgi:hypothetical protein
MIPTCSDNNVDTQEIEELKLPMEKIHGVEQLVTELMFTSIAEDCSLPLHHSHIERVPQELPSNIVALEEGSLALILQ